MKEIIRNGITVISVGFPKMGKAIGGFISNPHHVEERFVPEVIIRTENPAFYNHVYSLSFADKLSQCM